MNYLKSFKNNNPAQNMFLFSMALAFIGSVISLNWQAFIAWLCCFVTFIMFCGERDQNRFLSQELKDLRSEKISTLLEANQKDGKDQE